MIIAYLSAIMHNLPQILTQKAHILFYFIFGPEHIVIKMVHLIPFQIYRLQHVALSTHNERRGNTAKRGLDGSVCEKRAEEEESGGGVTLLCVIWESLWKAM